MKKSELENLHNVILDETVRRRKLGGYSMEAGGLLLICEVLTKLVEHLANAAKPDK